MFQLVITLIIVAVAAAIALYRFIRFLKNPLSKCDGCAKNCSGCAIEELKKDMLEKRIYSESNTN